MILSLKLDNNFTLTLLITLVMNTVIHLQKYIALFLPPHGIVFCLCVIVHLL